MRRKVARARCVRRTGSRLGEPSPGPVVSAQRRVHQTVPWPTVSGQRPRKQSALYAAHGGQ